jgi:hypothetical protein
MESKKMTKTNPYAIDIDFELPVLHEPAPAPSSLSMDDYCEFVFDSMKKCISPEMRKEWERRLPTDTPFVLD